MTTDIVERLMAMTEAEIDAELRSMGMEPSEAAERGKMAIERALEAAAEITRLRAEVEALRNAADYARNKIMLGSIQGRKSDRDEHLREAYNTLYPALKEHTNGR